MPCFQNKILLFFTASFPYGNKAETFIETEIVYLASAFEKIYIVPFYKESEFVRPLPGNCEILDFLCNPISKSEKVLLLIKNPLISAKIIINEISDKGFGSILKNKRVVLDILVHQIRNARLITKKIPVELLKRALIYDYWFENSTLTLSILKSKHKIKGFISRGHAFDIYDERWGTLGVPFKKFKLKYIDRLVFISRFGRDYFEAKTDRRFHEKYLVSRLGVNKHPSETNSYVNNIPLIISVSSVNLHKNVEFIPRLLSRLNIPLRWMHFGKGSEMDLLKDECESLPETVQWKLMGHVDNADIVRFYQNNKVDLFVSLSESEGLPVSMMEAQSFGIPIIAVPVGGIPEIVINGKTGFLFENHECIDENVEILSMALGFPFDKAVISDFFYTHFLASVNYQQFIDLICQNKV